MSIARDTLAYWTAQVANLATAVLTSAVVAVYLGSELRGIFVAALLANTLVVNMTNLGLQSTASYFIGQRERLARFHTLLVAMIGLIILIELVLGLLFGDLLYAWVLRKAAMQPAYLAAVFAIIPASLYLMAGQGMLIGLGRVRTLSRFLFYFTFSQNLASVIGLVWLDWRVPGLLAIWVVGQVAGAAALYLLIRDSGALWTRIAPREALAELRRMISYGLRAFYGGFAGVLVNRFDQVFIFAARGAIGIGIYNLSAKLAELIFQPAAALENAGYVRVRQASTAGEAARLARELFRTTFLINVVIVAVLIVLARPLVLLVYTEEYRDAILPLQILLPGTLMHSCSRMAALYFSAHLGRPQIPSTVTWMAAIVYLPALWWVVSVRDLGLLGAACVTTGGYGLILAGLLGWFMLKTGLWNPLPYILPQRRDLTRAANTLREAMRRRGV